MRGCFPGDASGTVKNLPVNAGDIRDVGSIPRLGESLEEGIATCLENPMAEEPGGLQSMGSQRVRHD